MCGISFFIYSTSQCPNVQRYFYYRKSYNIRSSWIHFKLFILILFLPSIILLKGIPNELNMKLARHGPCEGIYSKWDHFWHETGIGAINNAGKARHSPLRRTLWIIVFCAFSAFSLQGVVNVIQDYLAYPTATSISLKLATGRVNVYNFVWIYLGSLRPVNNKNICYT